MKYLLILLMICGVAYAQEPPYTPMKGNYKFKGIKVDSLFLIPSFADTTAANATNLDSISGAFIRTGNDFWMRNEQLTSWLQNVNVGPGSNPTTDLTLQTITDRGDSTTNEINLYGGTGNVKVWHDTLGLVLSTGLFEDGTIYTRSNVTFGDDGFSNYGNTIRALDSFTNYRNTYYKILQELLLY